jgi:hypothetical protein
MIPFLLPVFEGLFLLLSAFWDDNGIGLWVCEAYEHIW